MSNPLPPVLALLKSGTDEGGFQTDDVLATVLPLFWQTLAAHDAGFIAPLDSLQEIEVTQEKRLAFAESSRKSPRRNLPAISEILGRGPKALQILGSFSHSVDLDTGAEATADVAIAVPGTPVTSPVYISGYTSWEIAVGHHDEVTDIFLLGLVLGSFACGIDLSDPEDHEAFVQSRENLFSLNPRLNPVLASVIVQMTDLNRHRRAQDLSSLIRTLENYRDQPADLNLNRVLASKNASQGDRRNLILGHMRDRLFDLSRRNRLIHFKQSAQSLNLTVASVPLLLDYRNIQTEQLFFWHTGVANALTSGGGISLQKYLRFEDAPYIPSILDKIISEARRDRAEFGFAQLRLVICFLRWNNLKENPEERIHSPLLLLPVEVSKKRGIRDSYVLQPSLTEAEVNPALRHYLKQLYNLDLPESIDLKETNLEQFYENIVNLIRASEPAVTLTKIDRPQIQLVHERARQRLAQFNRRQRLTRERKLSGTIPTYSYRSEDIKPLGLELFLKYVKPSPAPLRDLAGAPPTPRLPNILDPEAAAGRDPVKEMSRDMFALRDGETQLLGNPYQWEFDLCALTLANFNYRKMTLVRDYSRLLETENADGPFDRIFSLEPKDTGAPHAPRLSLGDQFPVIACDATQASAIARARTGLSYIIQGPPGTGKSQTITNLIADYVARGKRVLFVCEKRAAIDVVFHRLRQRGLDELCCLIHDSQTDKKAFIQNLKQTSERWISAGDPGVAAENARSVAYRGMETELAALKQFSDAMTTPAELAGLPLRKLIERLVCLREHLASLTPREEEWLPPYKFWLEHGLTLNRLHSTLVELGEDPCFARHPFRWVSKAILDADRPLDELLRRLDKAEALLDEVSDALRISSLPENHWDSLTEIEAVLGFAVRLEPLRRENLLSLLDSRGKLAEVLFRLTREYNHETEALQNAQAKTIHWRTKLTPRDAETALAQATKFSNSSLNFLKPEWWRLRRVLRERYDFSQTPIEPAWTQILLELVEEWKVVARLENLSTEAQRQLGTGDILRLARELSELNPTDNEAESIKALRQALLTNPSAGQVVERLAALQPRFTLLVAELDVLFTDCKRHGFDALAVAVRDVRESSDLLPELLPILGEVVQFPEPLSSAVRRLELTGSQFEVAMGKHTLDETLRQDRGIQRFDSQTLKRHIESLEKHYRAWLDQNAAAIRARVQKKFLEQIAVASLPATQLNPEQQVLKKDYSAGRRDLEHEFGKTMRFKSIRDLASGSSGKVIRDLKPIWLMSPLSVSDTLPLEGGLFDVVIFDEASQIPVEAAVPAVFRAEQVIVVGDEMQLPPTNFFTAARSTEDEELISEEDGERIEVSLDADSFLAQSARNLPSTLLAWHYRSRYEALISFSNAAFYGGSLYTIPDRLLPRGPSPDITVTSPEQAREIAPSILERSISFHFVTNALYDNRRNAQEAAYIAELVRELLQRDIKLSLGIVAFSEAQQTEIEAALEALAESDKEFGARYDAELSREEDDQFCGLFVKNLENVQGDERDIIILSICYGPDSTGRTLMNFGPINQRGGEKRLNVIFSRARHHMVVVSSIRHHAITNDYNDGANALKNFLQYAESVSRGEADAARRILENLNPLARQSMQLSAGTHPVVDQLASALTARGYTVSTNVGQSRFRVDLAVGKVGEHAYELAILVDSDAHYDNPDFMERYLLQPAILRAFGWEPLVLLAKDWFSDPEQVLNRINRRLNKVVDDPEPEQPDSLEPEGEPKTSSGETSAAVAPTSAEGAGARRQFEFKKGASRKFWEISLAESSFTVHYGRIGTAGQTQTKTYPNPERARLEVEKLIAEKLKKGYVERSLSV